MYEPTWSQPLENYGQTGSFIEPATPPATPPDVGVLVQLPCINEDWLPLILGSLDQLRNPSSWLASLTDAQRYDVLGQVDRLRQMVAMAINVPCCNVAMRLGTNCVLQFSTNGGSTWSDVAGWSDNFATCVQQATIPPPILLPPGMAIEQRACSIAGYLANDIIKAALSQAITAYNDNLSLLAFAGNIAAITFAFDLPWTAAFIYAAYDVYKLITAGTIADFNAALADGSLWSQVTCAIFNAIRVDGQVTRVNAPAVIAAICGVTYPHSDVVTALCNFATTLGTDGLLTLEVPGPLDVVDCSGCGGAWCFEWNFKLSPGAWMVRPGYECHWVAGVGWVSNDVSPNNSLGLDLFFPATHLYNETIHYTLVQDSPGPDNINFALGGSFTHVDGLSGAHGYHSLTFPATNGTWDQITIVLDAVSGTGPTILSQFRIDGTGACPFGTPGCPDSD